MNLSYELSCRAGSARRHGFGLPLLGICLVLASGGIGLAQEEDDSSYSESESYSGDSSSSSAAPAEGGEAPAYVMPYALVIACIGLGLMLVCRSANRESLTKKWKGVGISATGEEQEEGKKGPPPRGPRSCPEAQAAMVWAILGLVCIPLLAFVALSKASEAKRQISQNPGMTGEGSANAAKIIAIITLVLWTLSILGWIVIVALAVAVGGGG